MGLSTLRLPQVSREESGEAEAAGLQPPTPSRTRKGEAPGSPSAFSPGLISLGPRPAKEPGTWLRPPRHPGPAQRVSGMGGAGARVAHSGEGWSTASGRRTARGGLRTWSERGWREARGAPAQLPAAISSTRFKESARLELHSQLAQAGCPSPGAPGPLPSGTPSPSTALRSTRLRPAPARRGALVRQGGGRPTVPGRGPRAGLGPGPPHP